MYRLYPTLSSLEFHPTRQLGISFISEARTETIQESRVDQPRRRLKWT
jgi:hypothetical protein